MLNKVVIISERSIYDQTVIRLVLYFFRNLTAIPDLNASPDATEETVRMASMQVRKSKRKRKEKNMTDEFKRKTWSSGFARQISWNSC